MPDIIWQETTENIKEVKPTVTTFHYGCCQYEERRNVLIETYMVCVRRDRPSNDLEHCGHRLKTMGLKREMEESNCFEKKRKRKQERKGIPSIDSF